MVKAIFSNPISRKVVATTMFATAVLSTSASSLKNTQHYSTINNTEILSKEASNALKVQTLTSKEKREEHNKKLDKLLLETCETQRDSKITKTYIDALYSELGASGAIIEIQRRVDDFYIEKAFDKYLQHYKMEDEDRDIANSVISHFYGWKDNVYYSDLFKSELDMYSNSKLPNVDECLKVVDNHINNKDFFTEEDATTYNEFTKRFISQQSQPQTELAKVDLLAYKIHLLNSIAFSNYFFGDKNMPKEHLLFVNMGYEFVNGQGVIKP